MKIVKHILLPFLIIALLCSGGPLFSPQDANRDTRVDLEDVILQVQDLTRTAETPEAFLPVARRAISALQVVAGVKVQIRPQKNDKSSGPFTGITQVYLIPSIEDLTPTTEFAISGELSFLYQSVFIAPETPPPRLNLCS